MATLHDARKTIQNGIFVFKLKKTVSQKEKKRIEKNQVGCFFEKMGFSHPWLSFNPFLWFFLDRTIWKKSRDYQLDWVRSAHLEYSSLELKNVRSAVFE